MAVYTAICCLFVTPVMAVYTAITAKRVGL